mmetsp:Transcript_48721/g.155741  ORF Transcript_48721/g.155741 Transcript_48721/m.155741 type:complete len:262 (+) Transcript_48721:607-1392(+)
MSGPAFGTATGLTSGAAASTATGHEASAAASMLESKSEPLSGPPAVLAVAAESSTMPALQDDAGAPATRSPSSPSVLPGTTRAATEAHPALPEPLASAMLGECASRAGRAAAVAIAGGLAFGAREATALPGLAGAPWASSAKRATLKQPACQERRRRALLAKLSPCTCHWCCMASRAFTSARSCHSWRNSATVALLGTCSEGVPLLAPGASTGVPEAPTLDRCRRRGGVLGRNDLGVYWPAWCMFQDASATFSDSRFGSLS